MLSQREIAAWRPHAPWPRLEQVEQDLLLTLCIEAIFSDDYLARQVAMRGGTVLHKVHLAPPGRYSEDIDLVAVGNQPAGHIVRSIWRVVEPIFNRPPSKNLIERVQLAVRNTLQKSEIRRLSWDYTPTSGVPQASVKIELNVSERTPVYAPVRLPLLPATGARPVTVVSYDVNEMLGTKLRALRQRTRGRDLFDLAYAWRTCGWPNHPHPISPPAVADAFLAYMQREGTAASRADFEADLAGKLRLGRFRSDLKDLLLDPDAYDVDAAAEIVRSVFLVYLP